MAQATVHRGPDDEGTDVDGPLLMGMRRLSIIDVDGGRQPIANEDGSLRVVCNGEIYNFQRLRKELQAAGHRFRTHSDTEVIVHMYEAYGDSFVERLDGMFAFALWDRRRRRLLIGRDRLGIKPLYYFESPRGLFFASEAKAILAATEEVRALDPGALGEYLALGYVPAPSCMFRGVRKLPPATLLIAEAGGVQLRRYWHLAANVETGRSEEEWVERVRASLEQAVVAQMVSDVPLGAFLSGGVDSSAVVALMARHSTQPVKTYAIGFDDSSGGRHFNELPYARQVADLFSTEHKEIVVRPDVAALMPRLIWHMDEPVADTAFMTTYLVSEFARRDVKVILSGVGGDELFGGYNRYLGDYYLRRYRRVPAWLRQGLIEPILGRLPSDRHTRLLSLSRYARSFVSSSQLSFEQRYRSYVQVMPAALRRDLLIAGVDNTDADALDRAFAEARHSDGLRRLLEVDLATQMADDLLALTDRMSMATSLECRVPLLDWQLLELAARIPEEQKLPGGRLKHLLKRALAPLLPPQILFRKKRGFGAPMGAWLKHELANVLGHLLSRSAVESRGLFHWPIVARIIGEHERGREDHSDPLLALMSMEVWCRVFLDSHSPADVTAEIAERAA